MRNADRDNADRHNADRHYGSDGQRRDPGSHLIPPVEKLPANLVARALKNATAQ
jgi:hypothetical protein